MEGKHIKEIMHTHSKQMTKFISQPLRLLIGRKQWNRWMENEENENSFSYLTWNAQLGKTKQKKNRNLQKKLCLLLPFH